MQQPILKSRRLTLRKFEPEDSARVAELAGNWEVARTTQNIPHPYTSKMATEWIASHQQDLTNTDRIVFAIILSDEDILVGTVSLMHIQNDEASLGYWIGQPYWGLGICTEAVSVILEYAFGKLGLKKVYADHLTSNPASGRVMIKSGMGFLENRSAIGRNGDTVQVSRYEIANSSD